MSVCFFIFFVCFSLFSCRFFLSPFAGSPSSFIPFLNDASILFLSFPVSFEILLVLKRLESTFLNLLLKKSDFAPSNPRLKIARKPGFLKAFLNSLRLVILCSRPISSVMVIDLIWYLPLLSCFSASISMPAFSSRFFIRSLIVALRHLCDLGFLQASLTSANERLLRGICLSIIRLNRIFRAGPAISRTLVIFDFTDAHQ